jgi:hypothetical protein
MTALDFPLNPSVGQAFGRWQWDGVKWVSVGAGSGGVPAAPAALFAWSNWGNMPTGQWLTQNVWNLVLNEGDWTANQNGDGFVVPEAGLYLVVLGLGTDAADVSRVILSIEGANSTGWLQETSAQRASASRVVRLAAGGEVRPFYYNRGPAITGGFTLSVVKIPEGGLPGPQGPPGDSLLSITSEKQENLNTFMDGQSDINLSDTAVYPFPTVAEISVSGLYMKPDRDVPVHASIWTMTHLALDNPANGANLTFARPVQSGGANWVALGDMTASMPVPANTAAEWVVRLVGVPGGATAFGYSFLVTHRRYKNGTA